jgi:hypothetical protein
MKNLTILAVIITVLTFIVTAPIFGFLGIVIGISKINCETGTILDIHPVYAAACIITKNSK